MSEGARSVHLLGARGPVGSALAQRLAAEPGLRLRAWSGGDPSYADFLASWQAAPDPEAVAVLAGGRVGGSAAACFGDHVLRTAHLVDAFAAQRWPRLLIVVGSAAELLPGSLYGLAKRVQRELAATAAAAAGACVLALRVHSVVPAERPPRGLLHDLLAGFEARGEVTVRHLGGARDYLTVGQLAAVVAACAAAPESASGAELLDVGNGRDTRVGDWIAALSAVFGPPRSVTATNPGERDLALVSDPGPLRALLGRAGAERLAEFDAAAPDLEAIAARWRSGARA